MERRKDYRDDTALRGSFNELAKAVFGLDFEGWYRSGYWKEAYNPYSMVENGRVVANVSVNRMEFDCGGISKNLIQLGTVMTAKEYRGRGLIRELMEWIEEDCAAQADGMFLFANDSVLEFYPKFGFRQAREYVYTRPVCGLPRSRMIPMPVKDAAARARLADAIRSSVPQGEMDQVHNEGLILFYVTQFMQDSVFYDPVQDAYVIAGITEGNVLLYNVFAAHPTAPEELAAAFGPEVCSVTPGFLPRSWEGYCAKEYREEDTTLFVKGNVFADFEKEKMLFPFLSHA